MCIVIVKKDTMETCSFVPLLTPYEMGEIDFNNEINNIV